MPGAAIAGLVARWRARHTPATLWCMTHALKRILTSMDTQLGTQLAREVPKVSYPKARQTTITPEEVQALLDHANPWMRLFVMLMANMALRFAEAMNASPEHYDPERQTLTITAKGGHRRTFPVPDEIRTLMELAPAHLSGTFIERLRGGQRIGADALREHWNKLRKAAGIRPEINPHDLRRTAAVRIYTLTKDVLAAKALLGHDSLASTAHYLQPYDPAAMSAVRKALQIWTPKGERVQ